MSSFFKFSAPFGNRSVVTLGVCTAVFLLLLNQHAFALAQSPESPEPASYALTLSPILTHGLRQPVFLGHAGDHRLFILEQSGRVRILQNKTLLPTPFLDVSGRVALGGEMGLLGLAFHPDFQNNGRFFINYSQQPDGATVLAEFQVSPRPNQALPHEKILLVIPQPYGNHNGGMLAFGPDGYLYMATGDGGSGGDPGNRGQSTQTLLGKILRMDVDGSDPYGIPPDNPFARRHTGREIFALGFRNPWRFSFDRETGELWAADVGQDDWEEIDVVTSGKNYGWRIMEGSHCFLPARGCSQAGLTLPVAEYRNQSSHCAVTGGYVYRGQAIPSLKGTYVFGDYCSGQIMGLIDGRPQVLIASGLRPASFGEDHEGELYVVDHGGGIYKITSSIPSTP